MTTATVAAPCRPEDVGIKFTPKAEPWFIDALTDYFSHFDAPRLSDRTNGIMMSKAECSCGRPLGGFVGTFTWGLVNGEGFCSNCKRPARALHRIKDPKDGSEIIEFGPITLLYREES